MTRESRSEVGWKRREREREGGERGKEISKFLAGRLTSSGNKNKCDSITGSIVTAVDRPLSIEDGG